MTQTVASQSPSQELFVKHGVLGLACDQVPPVLQRRKSRSTVLVASVHDVFAVYLVPRLRIVTISNQLPGRITCLATDENYVYAAVESKVFVCSFAGVVKSEFEPSASPIVCMLPFARHLIVVDSRSHIFVREIESGERTLELEYDPEVFTVTAICHPATYLNKVLFGSRQGSLRLVNLKTNKLIYTFKHWSSAVTCIEQSPAIDVVAVGFANGDIALHNLKVDETLFQFSQSDLGAVTALAFRSDGPAVLVSSSAEGHLAYWNLEKRRLISHTTAHSTFAVTAVHHLAGEPLFVSSGADNAIRAWVFDTPTDPARLHSIYDGHSCPPVLVRFHTNADDGSNDLVLSAGADKALRMFSAQNPAQRDNFGFAARMRQSTAKRRKVDVSDSVLGRITALSVSSVRENVWDNVIACHSGSPIVSTWTTRLKRLGSHRLRQERFVKESELKTATATSCAISACGNFALVGYSSGHCDVFNIQSGIYRSSLTDPSLPSTTAHTGVVRGVAVTSLNESAITCGADCAVKFWHFQSRRLKTQLKLSSPISIATLQQRSNLLAVALDDFSINIIDTTFHRCVREFSAAHAASISELAFTNDGSWLVSASLDCTLHVYDLPSASLVHVHTFDLPCTSLAVSTNDALLATTHSGQLGISLWWNKRVLAPHLPMRPLRLDDEGNAVEMEKVVDATTVDGEAEEKNDLLVRFSGLPETQWASLPQLDVIRARNKPTEPAQKPKLAPFFLAVESGLEPQFVTEQRSAAEQTGEGASRLLEGLSVGEENELSNALRRVGDDAKWTVVIDEMKTWGPSRLDVQIRGLHSRESLDLMLRMCSFAMRTRCDFEFISSILSVTLRHHRNIIMEEESLVDRLNDVRQHSTVPFGEIDDLFDSCCCLLRYTRSAVV